jgi:hypothetical protein
MFFWVVTQYGLLGRHRLFRNMLSPYSKVAIVTHIDPDDGESLSPKR